MPPGLISVIGLSMPSRGSPEPELFGLGDSRDEPLATVGLDDRRVVMLIERQVIDALAARARRCT